MRYRCRVRATKKPIRRKPAAARKEEFIRVRVASDLKRDVEIAADAAGMNVSTYCRVAVLEKFRGAKGQE